MDEQATTSKQGRNIIRGLPGLRGQARKPTKQIRGMAAKLLFDDIIMNMILIQQQHKT